MISFSPLPVTQRCKAWLFLSEISQTLPHFIHAKVSLPLDSKSLLPTTPQPHYIHRPALGGEEGGRRCPIHSIPCQESKSLLPPPPLPFSPIACKWRFVRKPFSRIGLAGGKKGNAQSPTYHFNKGKSKSRAFFITAKTPRFPPIVVVDKKNYSPFFSIPFFWEFSPCGSNCSQLFFFFLLRHSLPPSFSSLSSFLSISFLLPLPRDTGV